MKKTNESSSLSSKKKSHPFWQFFWLTFLVISLAFAWYSFYTPSNDVKWAENVTSVEQLTYNTNKKTLLFFTGKWCSPCRIMKREVFADKEVAEILNSQIIPRTINVDDPNNIELVKHYKVGATPTTIIIDSEGKVLEYSVGKIEKSEFLEMLNAHN